MAFQKLMTPVVLICYVLFMSAKSLGENDVTCKEPGNGGSCTVYHSRYTVSNRDCTCFRLEDLTSKVYDYVKCPPLTIFSTERCRCVWEWFAECSQPASTDICSKDEERKVTTPGPAPNLAKLTEATGRFNAALMTRLQAEMAGKGIRNVVVSAFSIHTVMAMVYEGARTKTRSEMGSAMYYDIVPNLKASYRQLLMDLNYTTVNTTLLTANRVYPQDKYPFLKSYMQIVRDYYLSEIVPSDFSNPILVRRQINTWVQQRTEGLIKDLLPPRSISAGTVMVIVNALYFKGFWENPFNPNKTTSEKFFVGQNQHVMVEMMTQVEDFKYLSNQDYQALSLPYKGRRLAMAIILPRDFTALEKITKSYSYDFVNNVQNALHAQTARQVRVFFPKFKAAAKYELKRTLTDMGMPSLFSSAADLSGMNGHGGLSVSNVIHEAVVDVNEEGTEAAAATAVIIFKSSRLVFNVNRPFIFTIYVVETGHVLFAGRIGQP